MSPSCLVLVSHICIFCQFALIVTEMAVQQMALINLREDQARDSLAPRIDPVDFNPC